MLNLYLCSLLLISYDLIALRDKICDTTYSVICILILTGSHDVNTSNGILPIASNAVASDIKSASTLESSSREDEPQNDYFENNTLLTASDAIGSEIVLASSLELNSRDIEHSQGIFLNKF